MRYEIDGSPRRMREGAKETLRVPAVSIIETNVVGTNVDPLLTRSGALMG